jgi:hypothetical protein
MTEETLRQLLARVHERLNGTSTIDSETRDMLATVMRDIDAALAKGAVGAGRPGATSGAGAGRPGATSGADAVPSVTTPPVSADARVAAAQPRLEALAVRFEAEHPSLAQLLRQLGDLLGKAGI